MNKQQTVTKGKKRLQWLFSVILACCIGMCALFVYKTVTDEKRSDLPLFMDLNAGRYGKCVDYFYVLRLVSGVEEEVYDRYEEFVDFYENYILYVEYTQYDERHQTAEHQEEAEECRQVMHRISENTTFFENAPHYEYLLDTLEK